MAVVPMKGEHHENWQALLSEVAHEFPNVREGMVIFWLADGTMVAKFTHLTPERVAYAGADLLRLAVDHTQHVGSVSKV